MRAALLVVALTIGVLGVGWLCYGALMCRHGRHATAPEDATEFAARCVRCNRWFIANP